MNQDLQERCLKYSGHIGELCGISCAVMDTVARSFVTGEINCDLCRRCNHPKRDPINTHLYGSNEAYRWNGRYIYYCPMGLVFVASSVSDERGLMTASLVAGPMVMGEMQDTLYSLPSQELKSLTQRLPVFSTRRVHDLAEIMAAVTSHFSGMPHSKMGNVVYEQEKILNSIYQLREKAGEGEEECIYPIQFERQLHQLIGQHDREGSRRLLNELLGYVFVSSEFDLRAVKARVMELIVVLSRATIDAGADQQEILWSNAGYLAEVERFQSVEDLSVWLTGVMNRFLSYTFDFTQVKHSDMVYKVMEYINQNYSKKLSLQDLADRVYLSRSYLSSLFKKETGDSITNYINRVRVEKSKALLVGSTVSLAEVAHLCGFEDQSYFTRVFKAKEGVSPKKFRDKRGNLSKDE